jgi:hypothetical protein
MQRRMVALALWCAAAADATQAQEQPAPVLLEPDYGSPTYA